MSNHYKQGKFECIEVLEDLLSKSGHITPIQAFYWGNAFKYIWRLWFKENAIADAKKAIYYLEMLIVSLEENDKTE